MLRIRAARAPPGHSQRRMMRLYPCLCDLNLRIHANCIVLFKQTNKQTKVVASCAGVCFGGCGDALAQRAERAADSKSVLPGGGGLGSLGGGGGLGISSPSPPQVRPFARVLFFLLLLGALLSFL